MRRLKHLIAKVAIIASALAIFTSNPIEVNAATDAEANNAVRYAVNADGSNSNVNFGNAVVHAINGDTQHTGYLVYIVDDSGKGLPGVTPHAYMCVSPDQLLSYKDVTSINLSKS